MLTACLGSGRKLARRGLHVKGESENSARGRHAFGIWPVSADFQKSPRNILSLYPAISDRILRASSFLPPAGAAQACIRAHFMNKW